MTYATLRKWLFCALSMTVFGPLSAQTPIVIDANNKRQLIPAFAQNQTILLEHLQTGETYWFIIPADEAAGTCQPEISLPGSGAELLQNDVVHHQLQFKALASTVALKLHYPCKRNEGNAADRYVSIACQSCAVKKNEKPQSDMAVLEVQQAGVEELIREVFVGGACFDISNVTYSGDPRQIGTFKNGQSNIGFASGMLMSTGDISQVPGPNDQDGSGGSVSGLGTDIDLGSVATGVLYDLTMIEFDFTPTQTPLTFSFVFASEEYCEYVNSTFNDALGLFISGPGITGAQNLAVLPASTTPISINTVNHVVNSGQYVPNAPTGLDNCETGGVTGNLPPQSPANGPATQEVQFDGFTRKLITAVDVLPCSTYHMKLAIADVADPLRDAAVFFKGGSFDAGGAASINWVVNGDPELNEVVEGCGTAQILVDRLSADVALPLPVTFMISGTAASGSDFSAITSVIVIPAGQDKVLVPVNVVNDLVPEGAETIILKLNNACSCQNPQEILTILDESPTIILTADTVAVCGQSGNATVSVSIEGGVAPFSYLWSTGSTQAVITPFVNTSTDFTVTVTDNCGEIATAVARIEVGPSSTVLINCPNMVSVQVAPGTSNAVVTYDAATTSSDCVCPGTGVVQSSGLSSGSTFPLGISQVCYQANDSCGQTASCCFNITVAEDTACDIRMTACVKYELLTVTKDQFNNKTYRIRVTNNCANELIYTVIQLPAALAALFPENNTIYTAPGGNEYVIRNPNFSPFYSVRYRALNGGIANGESDILYYTLPSQADVQSIHISSRLSVQVFYEADLNTLNCPVIIMRPDAREHENPSALTLDLASVFVFPNPSESYLQVDLAAWEGETVQLRVFNSQGQRVLGQRNLAAINPQRIDLPQGIADGLYILDLTTEAGDKEVVKFVVKH